MPQIRLLPCLRFIAHGAPLSEGRKKGVFFFVCCFQPFAKSLPPRWSVSRFGEVLLSARHPDRVARECEVAAASLQVRRQNKGATQSISEPSRVARMTTYDGDRSVADSVDSVSEGTVV